MKIRIEGCTAEELAEESDYLSLGKDYPAREVRRGCYLISNEVGYVICVLLGKGCAHLSKGGHWVEVQL